MKLNYRRKKVWKLKLRSPSMRNKVIDPNTVYKRDREKRITKEVIHEYL